MPPNSSTKENPFAKKFYGGDIEDIEILLAEPVGADENERRHHFTRLFVHYSFTQLYGQFDHILKSFGELSDKLTKHMEEEEEERAEHMRQNKRILAELESIRGLMQAFPVTETGEPDINGHRHDHESRIQHARAQESFWQARKAKIIDTLIQTITTAMLVALALGVQQWLLHGKGGM